MEFSRFHDLAPSVGSNILFTVFLHLQLDVTRVFATFLTCWHLANSAFFHKMESNHGLSLVLYTYVDCMLANDRYHSCGVLTLHVNGPTHGKLVQVSYFPLKAVQNANIGLKTAFYLHFLGRELY